MKQQIDNLIANTLLDERELYLPTVGTLILSRQAATLLSKKMLQPPFYQLRFTTEERGVSIISCISRVASVSLERASDIYDEWLSLSLRDGVVTINGGTVTAVAHTTGTAIGGGIGFSSAGGPGYVTITGGNIYAYNLENPHGIPSAAIGGAGSRDSGEIGRAHV